MSTTPEEALAAIRQSAQDASGKVAALEAAIAAEIQRDKDSRALHTATMRELRPALAAAREAEAGWVAMLPRAPRAPRTTAPAPAEALTLSTEG